MIKTGLEKGKEAGYEAEAQVFINIDCLIWKIKKSVIINIIKGFADLGMTSESKALINIFQGHTNCKKNRFGNPAHEAKY